MTESIEGNLKFEQTSDASLAQKQVTPIAVDVGIDTRITFVDKHEIGTVWLPASKVAEQVGTYDRFVYRLVKELGIESRIVTIDGIDISALPPYTTALVKEELAWRKSWHELPSQLMFSQIVELIGRSHGWTKNTLDTIGARPTRSEVDNIGRVIELYPKDVLKTLRGINMAVPMDDGWYPMQQIVTNNGVDRDWASVRLKKAGFLPERRRSSLTGKILDHYPPSATVFVQLAKEERPAPGGTWLTALGIAEYIGRSEGWVRRRIDRFADSADTRLDDQSVPRTHYPPYVVKELIKESTVQASLPDVEDFISFHTLHRNVGHTASTTSHLLEGLGIEPEPRKDKLGRVQLYYDPSSITRITEFVTSLEPSPEELVISATFAVGSLRARIKAYRRQLQILNSYGEMALSSQLDELKNNIAITNTELKKAQLRYYRIIKKYEHIK